MIKEPNLKQVKKIISKVYPEAKVLDFKKSSIGNINWVYFISLKNPTKKIVLKVVWRKDREEDEILDKEANIIKKLNGNKIKGVPQLIDFDHSKKDVPFVYLLESFLEGEPLFTCYEKLKFEDLKIIIKEVARLISKIQKIKYNKITEFEKNRPDSKSFSKFVKDSTPKHYKVCIGSDKISNDFVEESFKFILEESKKIKDTEFVLNHSDVGSRNFLIHQNKFSAVVDFEATQTMTPEYDLVTLYHEFLWKVPALWPIFLQEYVRINKVPDDFKERLNIVMGYRSFRYLYIAIKNNIYQYFDNDVIRMEEVLDGRFLQTIKY